MDEFYAVVAQLPRWLAEPLAEIPAEVACKTHEIRFKTGAMPMLTHAGKQAPVANFLLACRRCATPFSPVLQSAHPLAAPLTLAQIDALFFHLCGGSVHSYEDELSQGFFTLAGGHRVGVGGKYIPSTAGRQAGQSASSCGQFAHTGRGGWQLQQVTSLNIRIARNAVVSLPDALTELLPTGFTSILLLGEPDSGKTTVLRSLVAACVGANRAVVVIDERNELAVHGADSIAGMEKSNAVQLALRTLSPEVIVLDELGTLEELHALEQGFFGGAAFIATMHAGSFAEAAQKPQFQYLNTHGMLGTACLLQGRHAPSCIAEIQTY